MSVSLTVAMIPVLGRTAGRSILTFEELSLCSTVTLACADAVACSRARRPRSRSTFASDSPSNAVPAETNKRIIKHTKHFMVKMTMHKEYVFTKGNVCLIHKW